MHSTKALCFTSTLPRTPTPRIRVTTQRYLRIFCAIDHQCSRAYQVGRQTLCIVVLPVCMRCVSAAWNLRRELRARERDLFVVPRRVLVPDCKGELEYDVACVFFRPRTVEFLVASHLLKRVSLNSPHRALRLHRNSPTCQRKPWLFSAITHSTHFTTWVRVVFVTGRQIWRTCSLHLDSLTQYLPRLVSICSGAYQYLLNEEDHAMLPWIKRFQKFDLYSKSTEVPNMAELMAYYKEKINK